MSLLLLLLNYFRSVKKKKGKMLTILSSLPFILLSLKHAAVAWGDIFTIYIFFLTIFSRHIFWRYFQERRINRRVAWVALRRILMNGDIYIYIYNCYEWRFLSAASHKPWHGYQILNIAIISCTYAASVVPYQIRITEKIQ